MSKVITLDTAVEMVKDGMTIMIGGFLGVGSPLKSIKMIAESGVKDLTLISVVSTHPGGRFDLALLFANKCVRKFITSHIGTSPEALELYKSGELEVEFYPMGTWTEKVRSAGFGLGGVLTPVGLGTLVEDGKQKLTVEGSEYLVETPLNADMAFIKGYSADRLGNIQYRHIAVNSNSIIAPAGKFTVAEVNSIVEVGSIEPDRVGTPGVFVQAVVQGYSVEEQERVFEELWTECGQLVQET